MTHVSIMAQRTDVISPVLLHPEVFDNTDFRSSGYPRARAVGSEAQSRIPGGG